MARERAFRSRDPETTMALAEALGRLLPRGAVLALEGELGAGKTTFVRGLARGLDLSEPVTSPTFTLMHRYEEGSAGRVLEHYDAWMESRERAFLADGAAELLLGADVAAIEWAERVVDWLPPERLAVRLAHLSPSERTIELEVRGAGPLARVLEEALDALEAPPGAQGPPGGPSSPLRGPARDRD